MAMRLLLLLFIMSACTPLPEAPGELDELGGYLFLNWEDDLAMQSGIRSFDENMVNLDFDAERSERSFELTSLSADEVEGIDNPDGAVLDNVVGVALGRRTDWEPIWHARLATRVDQSPAEPSSDEYARDFLDPTDPSCFPDQDCASLTTLNDVLKVTALYTVRIDMWKNFRWVDVLDEDGHDTGRDAIVAKVWTPEAFEGEQGNTWLYQSYAIDVWLDTEDQGPIRVQYNWSEISISDDAEVIRNTVRWALDQLMARTDEYIAEEIAN